MPRRIWPRRTPAGRRRSSLRGDERVSRAHSSGRSENHSVLRPGFSRTSAPALVVRATVRHFAVATRPPSRPGASGSDASAASGRPTSAGLGVGVGFDRGRAGVRDVREKQRRAQLLAYRRRLLARGRHRMGGRSPRRGLLEGVRQACAHDRRAGSRCGAPALRGRGSRPRGRRSAGIRRRPEDSAAGVAVHDRHPSESLRDPDRACRRLEPPKRESGITTASNRLLLTAVRDRRERQ